MNLRLVREDFSEKSAIGKLFVNDEWECFILEDTDRKLNSQMSLEEIKRIKIPGQTAIPLGKYQIDVTWSVRFNRLLPILLNVPGYEGVRIHPGNAPVDTHGCLLPGKIREVDRVFRSKEAFHDLFDKILTAIESKEEVWIEILMFPQV